MNYLNEQYGHSGIHAKLVAASIDADGHKILTMETKAPKFIDAEFEKHRIMSSSSSSSRAKPFGLLDETYIPFDVRWAQSGMQGDKQAEPIPRANFIRASCELYQASVDKMFEFKDKVHKQHLNRYIEPWMFQYKVVTSTEWYNFFNLRLASDVQPEMAELARMMKRAYDTAEFTELEPGQWHTPYCIDLGGLDISTRDRLASSAAGCARVSYGVLGGSGKRTLEADVSLAEDLLSKMHMTPFEHQALPMILKKSACGNPSLWQKGVTHMDRQARLWSGNLRGFVQNRQLLQGWN